jgi:hypothetical protein
MVIQVGNQFFRAILEKFKQQQKNCGQQQEKIIIG